MGLNWRSGRRHWRTLESWQIAILLKTSDFLTSSLLKNLISDSGEDLGLIALSLTDPVLHETSGAQRSGCTYYAKAFLCLKLLLNDAVLS